MTTKLFTSSRATKTQYSFCVLVVLLFCSASTYSQTLTDTLKEVNVHDKRKQSNDERINSFSPGQKLITFDSTTLQQYRMQSVASLLSQQTPVFIKSYGINGLATLNFRGSSAAQSQVYWNGVPIQNAALGIADLSSLPVAMINRLHIIYGSSAALWGSGNVGGALLLESDEPAFSSSKAYEIAFGAGSFNQHQAGGKVSISSKRISFTANVFAQTAENDFKYEDEYGQKKTNENAKLNGLAVLSQLGYKLNEKNVLRFCAWYQDYYREIPAALFEAYSVKKRDDESLRLLLDWNRKTENNNFYARTSFLTDKMNYSDRAAAQSARNESYQYYAEAGWKKKISPQHQFMLFTPLQVSWMDNTAGDAKQTRYALAGAYTYTSAKEWFIATVSAREEIINEQVVFLPGVNASYAVTDWWKLRANVQRTYRAPSLNELYFEPGGNKKLKAEHGWHADIGYRIESAVPKKFSISHDVSAFNRVIDDWILWYGGAIWTPHNIASVHSRGLETENLIAFPVKKWKLYLGYNASYILATTISSYIPNDQSTGKQIPYTPKFISQANAGFSFKKLQFNYHYAYTGYRYINMDETGYLPSFGTHNVQANYRVPITQRSLLFTLQANNLLDARYQVVSSRQMPGINWLAGVSMKF